MGESLGDVRAAAAGCQACDLWKSGTQTVFGEGSEGASLMLVGEQPGDKEDLAGRPFVGPAGRILDQALEEAGIDRSDVYVTNAVKHFKWEPRGKRRLHKRPDAREIAACRPWLDKEIALVTPQVVVCLGATAAQSLLGPQFRITRDRGRFFDTEWASWITATLHPSAILRMPDREKREEARALFLADLRNVLKRLQQA